jgi:hypothetical protein
VLPVVQLNNYTYTRKKFGGLMAQKDAGRTPVWLFLQPPTDAARLLAAQKMFLRCVLRPQDVSTLWRLAFCRWNLKKAPYEVKAASAIGDYIIIIFFSPQMAHLMLQSLTPGMFPMFIKAHTSRMMIHTKGQRISFSSYINHKTYRLAQHTAKTTISCRLLSEEYVRTKSD